uniref:Uncharacterized protein n=1 Tax=Salix viminalis TaxID=40686 RepID=A0A6N2NDR8_SALVM
MVGMEVEWCCKAYPGAIELSPLLVRCYCRLVMISTCSLSRLLRVDMFMSDLINCPNNMDVPALRSSKATVKNIGKDWRKSEHSEKYLTIWLLRCRLLAQRGYSRYQMICLGLNTCP